MAPNNQQRMDWISKIDEARACLSSERSSQVNKGAAPVWMPDHTSEDCVVCRASFSIWRRRHHCKSCGSLVCAQHSRNKVLLPHVNASESQRVCDICFNSLRPAGIEQYQETERDMEDDSDFVVTSSRKSASRAQPSKVTQQQSISAGTSALHSQHGHRASMPSMMPPPVPSSHDNHSQPLE